MNMKLILATILFSVGPVGLTSCAMDKGKPVSKAKLLPCTAGAAALLALEEEAAQCATADAKSQEVDGIAAAEATTAAAAGGEYFDSDRKMVYVDEPVAGSAADAPEAAAAANSQQAQNASIIPFADVSQESTVTRAHQGASGIAIARNGSVCVVYTDHEIYGYMMPFHEAMQPVKIYSKDAIESVVVSPDGSYMLVGTAKGLVRICHSGSLSCIQELDIHSKKAVKQCAFKTGKHNDRDFYSVSSGILRHSSFSMTPGKSQELKNIMRDLPFLKALGRPELAGIVASYLGEWRACNKTYKIDENFEHAVFSPNAKYLAVSRAQLIRLWNTKKMEQRPKCMYIEYPGRVTAISVSKQGRYVTAGLESGEVCQWTLSSALLKNKYDSDVPDSAFTSLGAHAGSRFSNTVATIRSLSVPRFTIVSGSADTLMHWNSQTKKLLDTKKCNIGGPIVAAEMSDNGQLFILTTNGTFMIYLTKADKD